MYLHNLSLCTGFKLGQLNAMSLINHNVASITKHIYFDFGTYLVRKLILSCLSSSLGLSLHVI